MKAPTQLHSALIQATAHIFTALNATHLVIPGNPRVCFLFIAFKPKLGCLFNMALARYKWWLPDTCVCNAMPLTPALGCSNHYKLRAGIFFCGATARLGPRPSLTAEVSRSQLDILSKHKRRTSIPLAEFDPACNPSNRAAAERPHSRTATRIG